MLRLDLPLADDAPPVGIAQTAGFKLREIEELIDGIDGLAAWATRCARSVLKLGEVDTQPNRSKDLRASGA